MRAPNQARLRTRRRLLATLLAPWLAAGARPGWAQTAPGAAADTVYVVVAAASPIESADSKDLFDVYTGRLPALPGVALTLPVEHARGHPARSLFYAAIGTATPAQVDSHWARLQFSGRLRPPPSAADEADMLRRVKADPQSIGYVTSVPKEAGLRVVLRLARRPAAAG